MALLWCVRMTEYNYVYLPCPLLHEDEVVRTIERQLNLIAVQSLLKAASDLAPLRSATDLLTQSYSS